MKKWCFLSCLIGMAATTVFATDIRGKLVGYQGELVLVKAEKIDTLKVSKDGTFAYHYRAASPYMEIGFFRFGKDPVIIRANDGDKIELEAVKEADGHVRVTFEGDRKELNHYLTYYEYRNGFEQWPMEKIAAMPFREHAAAVEKMEKELNGLLNKAKEDPALITGLREQLRVNMLALKQRYCWAVRAINQERMDKDADYVKFARSLNMNDEAWYEREKDEQTGGYTGLLDGRVRWEMAVQDDPRVGTELSTAAYMEWVRKLVSSELIANVLVNSAMEKYLSMGGNAKTEETYEAYLKCSTDPAAKKDITAKYKVLTGLPAGKPAPDFEMKDVNGKVYKLSDFRGKNLYIDVWATWCGPCVGEIPYFEKKHQQYKDKTGLEFISISVDVNVAGWKKKLSADQPRWKQFIVGTDSELTRLYGINAIPRFMLIDKEGKIITVNAPRPSDEKIDAYLEKLAE